MEGNHLGPRPQNEPQKASKKRKGVKHKATDYSDMNENSEMNIPTTWRENLQLCIQIYKMLSFQKPDLKAIFQTKK